MECAFWKEEPSLRDALFLFDPESIREVYVVPNFISEGYFTQTVVPRELELNGRITKRSNGQIWRYCEPVGNHPLMTELLLKRARDVAPDAVPAETSLLIVAHGTDLNENSAVAAKRETEKIRALGKYAAVLNVYMEEPPLVSDWRKLTETQTWLSFHFLFLTDYTATKTFRDCWESMVSRRLPSRRRPAHGRLAKPPAPRQGDLSARIRTGSMVAICFMLHPSAPTLVLLTSLSSRRTRPQKVEIVLALGFLCARLFPRE